MKTKQEITKEFNAIKKIIRDYFEEDFCTFDKKDNYIDFPAGNISLTELKGKQVLYYDSQYLFTLLNSLNKKLPQNIEIFEGFYLVFTEDHKYVDMLWQSEIRKYMDENNVDFDIAKNILTNKIVVENSNK
jgi:hypothetical protein